METLDLNELCNLYNDNPTQNKILKQIIKSFDYQNDDHYMVMNTILDNNNLIKGIVKNITNLNPVYEFNGENRALSQNGKFSLGNLKNKLTLIATEQQQPIADLNDQTPFPDVNNNGTQIISGYNFKTHTQVIYDISEPSDIMIHQLPSRSSPHNIIHTRWSPNCEYFFMCYDRLESDNVGPDTCTAIIMNTEITSTYRDIHIFELIDGKYHHGPLLSISNDKAYSAVWSYDSKYLAVSYQSNLVRIWNISKSEVIHKIANIAFDSAVGYNLKDYLATVTKVEEYGDDYIINIWNTETWQLLNKIETTALCGGISSLSFHCRKPYLLISVNLGYTSIWNYSTGIKILNVNYNRSHSFSTFNDAGTQIISSSGIWNMILIDDIIDFLQKDLNPCNFKRHLLQALKDRY